MIKLTVNGKPEELPEPVSILEFLKGKNVNTQFVAVAHNGKVLHQKEYAQVTLQDGDAIEVVRPVGGG